MYAALDRLMSANLPQMELYYEIGRLVCCRTEKGAAVAAAEYLQKNYPNTSGFSSRNLRRMRDFFQTYGKSADLKILAMEVGWIQNIVILEADLTMDECIWYLRAAARFGWSKSELTIQIDNAAHLELSLDDSDSICYTEYIETAQCNNQIVGSLLKKQNADCLAVCLLQNFQLYNSMSLYDKLSIKGQRLRKIQPVYLRKFCMHTQHFRKHVVSRIGKLMGMLKNR